MNVNDLMLRAVVAVLLMACIILLVAASCTTSHAQNYFAQHYDGKQYRRCPLVDPECRLLPRQGQPLQPTPREQRLVYDAARDLAIQRGYLEQQRANDPFEQPGRRPPSQPHMNQQQWKEAIINEGTKYCNSYPKDEICHFSEPVPPR